MHLIIQKSIEIYVTSRGRKPFIEWLESLQDKTARYRIKECLDRLSLGNLGDFKSIGEGVFEQRLNFGSGYRIYFGHNPGSFVLLLCAGNKATQKKDIQQAKAFWKDYLER